MAFVSHYIAHLTPYEPGKPIDEVKRELGVEDPVKLASNENAWGPSPRVIQAIRDAVPSVHLYPDGGAYYLKQALAGKLGVDPAMIAVGNGSNEVLDLIVRTFLGPGMNAVCSAASFIAYKLCTVAAGFEFREAPLGEDFGYDLDALLAQVDAKTRVIFIANPNNPTGTLIGADALARFIAAVDARCAADPPVIVLDEAYYEYVQRDDMPDGIAWVRRRPRTIVTRTFSKAYGLAGTRCGYGIASPDIVGYMNRVRAPFNVNSLAQVGAVAALQDPDWVQHAVRETLAARAELYAGLEALGVRVVPSETNFLLVDFGVDGLALNDALMRRGVICRPVRAYGLPTCLRITVGKPDENAKLLAALPQVLAQAR